jgi:hypothetical protein
MKACSPLAFPVDKLARLVAVVEGKPEKSETELESFWFRNPA